MRKTLVLMLIIIVGPRLCAQCKAVSGDIQNITELQSDFKEDYNWVNLFTLNLQLSSETLGIWRNGFLDMELISIYRTSKERIADDRQVFSNIDEQSQALGIFTLGYTHLIGKANLFFGLRNANRDYFTTPYTSLFTNSSCGIYPTISANYLLANYPLSAMCLHTEYEVNGNWSIKNSLYNGTAYESLKQTFTINPERDGIFNMTQFSYTQQSKQHGIYHLGTAVHSRMPMHNENSESPFKEKKTSQKTTKVDYSLWASIEQCVYVDNGREIGVLAQCSFVPSGTSPCSQYYGVGLLFNGWTTRSKKDQLGVFINSAKFDNEKEISLELTWKHQLTNNLEIQPAFHLIKNSGNMEAIGMLRLAYALHIP